MPIAQAGDAEGGAPHVLLVEGSPSIHRHLGQRLQDQGVVLMTVDSVQAALEVLDGSPFGVVIADRVLPDGSGLEVLDAVRSSGSATHVIVMSGSADSSDRAAALERGADAYVVKPCQVRELTSRVLAVGRWADPEVDALLTVGPLTIDLQARQVRSPDKVLHLTSREFDLLAFLAARPGHVFSKAELLRAVWQSNPEWQQAATVTEHIRRLRAKIEVEPRHPRILRTVRGSGYRLDLPETDAPTGDGAARFEPGTIIHVGGRIVHADRAAGALLGPTPAAELIGCQIFELAATASRRATRERMALARGPARRSQLIDLERSDGTELSVEVASELTTWEGQPAGTVTLTHVPDLSARLRRLVTGALSEVTDAVIITDLHYHVRSWNKAAERLYGWREHDVLGRHLLDVVQPRGDIHDDDDDLAAAWEHLEDGGRWKGEVCHRTRDGSEVDVLSCTTLVRESSGEPILIVAVNRPAPTATSVREAAALYDDDQIRQGLASDAFVVHFQPIVDLADGQVIAMEALVRWDHPERGLLAPDAFLPAAERSGAIIELGILVLEKACTQAAAWQRDGRHLALSVNISARQLTDPELYDRIMTVLAFTGLEAGHLWLEVTETALIDDVDQASAVLHRLAGHGIGITIDDFGTGWASLTYLRSFPIHALKIDRSFVAGLGSHTNDDAIARSILALGAELGLIVVAEGIETRAQQHALQELGCTIGQGFLFGQPVPDPYPVHPEGVGSAAATTTTTSALSPLPRARATIEDAARVRPTLEPIARLAASKVLAPQAAILREVTMTADGTESDIVADLLRGLLRIRSAPAAAELLQRTVRSLGGLPIPAVDASEHALPVDVSLGEGPPMLVEVDPFTVAHMQLERLLPRLVEDARRAVDLLRQTERLVHETARDQLTGLANRRVLDRVLPRAATGSVVMIDLDHFKEVNDQHGHAAGDAVLVSFGKVLIAQVRAQDTSCRIGGEEFALVLIDTDCSGALELVDRIRTAWPAAAPQAVTFSAGVAPIDVDGGTAALLAADRALYQAKDLGRDRTELAAPSIIDR